MNQQRRKAILSDPLKCFQMENPAADSAILDKLKEITESHQNLKKQLKDEQTKSKAISRKIGEAKRKGETLDSLKRSMQKQSQQVKQLDENLKAQERHIFEYFSVIQTPSDRLFNELPPERAYKSTSIDTDMIDISLLEEDIEDWNSYVALNPAASLYHKAEWQKLIRQTFGHECFYFIARNRKKQVVGILPLIRLNSRLFGDFLISMPYFNYGGAIADHPEIENRLIEFANDLAGQLKVNHVEYRDDIKRHGLPVLTHKVDMLLTLPRDSDTLWNSFSSKLRAQIKRPYKENPQISFGGKALLNDFYTVFSRNMRDLGTPVYAKKFFHNILETFPDESTIISLKINNKPVAAGFLLNHGKLLEIPWASTIKSVNPLSMNMLMYWEVLKYAIELDIDWFDFGRSTVDAGTYRFKKQWGAQPKQLYWHYWLNKGEELPSLNPSNPKYAVMIEIWKRLPVLLTKILGPSIVKNLP